MRPVTRPTLRKPVVDVRDFGAVGDGTNDDTTAIDNAQLALPSTGGIVYFPPGTYKFTGNGLLLKKSNITYKGAGMYATTLKRTTTSGPIVQSSASFKRRGIAFEDLCFDWDRPNPGSASTIAVTLNGLHVNDVRFSRCRFWNGPNTNLQLQHISDVSIEDCLFHSPGTALSEGIKILRGSRRITIRRNRFLYLHDGIIIDTGSTTDRTEEVCEFIDIDNNYFDLAWWLLTAVASGSGGTVTYTATVLTDTAAAFSGLSTGINQNVRVMPVKETGTGTVGGLSITDASATFLTNSVQRGDILRIGTAFAVVAEVQSETVLWVEEWLSDSDRTYADSPSTGTYTVYGVYLGEVTTNTSTTITSPRWWDLDGNAVTPDAGTRYEVMQPRPNYPCHMESSARYIKVRGNTLRRGWSDQVSVYGHRVLVSENIIEDGQDMGITLDDADDCLISNNIVRHQGAGGITIEGNDNEVIGNYVSESTWENFTNTTTLGDIMVRSGARNRLIANRCEGRSAPLARRGIVVYDDSDDNWLVANKCLGHSVAGISVRDATTQRTKLRDNDATFEVVSAVDTDLGILTGTATWDPADTADGAMTSTTVTVTGAAIGNPVSVGFSNAVPAGAVLAGSVTAANTVTVTLFNKTGSNLNLGSGTLRASVWQYN